MNEKNIHKVEQDEADFDVDPFDQIGSQEDDDQPPKQKPQKKKGQLKNLKKSKKDKKKKKKKIQQEQLLDYPEQYDDEYDEDNQLNSMFDDEAESDEGEEEEEGSEDQFGQNEREIYDKYVINKNRTSDKFLDRFKNKSEKQINALYSKQLYKRRENQEMYPGEKDPKLYVVNVSHKHEDQMVLKILNKAKHLANTANKVSIVSAMALKKHPGRIFVEAFAENDVRQSLEGFNNVSLTRKINELDMDSYVNLFNEKVENKVTFQVNMYVRIKKGLYEGDLGKIYKVKKSSVDLLLVPRINIQDIVMKIRQQTSKMTDPVEITKTKQQLLKLFINHRTNNYRQRPVKKSIMEEDLSELRDIPGINSIRLANINGLIILNYRFDEIDRVKGTYLPVQIIPFTAEGDYLQEIKEEKKNFVTTVSFKKGEEVQVIAGELIKNYGILMDIKDNIGVVKCTNKEMRGEIIEQPLQHLAKRFKQGQRVKVISGADIGKTGLILSVEPRLVEIWTDNNNSIKINKKNLELHSGEVICEQNVHQLKKDDLIKTSKGVVGIVLETRKDSIKILDVNNTIQVIGNIDCDSALNTRNFNAKNNRSGQLITSGSSVVINKGIHEGKRCKVVHVYLQYVFLFNESFDRTAGISVEVADNCSLIAKRDAKSSKPMPINNINNSFGVSNNDSEDLTIGKTITLRTGPLKGYQGVIKNINKEKIEVRVPSKSCTVSVPREKVGAKSETQQIGKTPNRRGGPQMTHIYAASPLHKY